MRGVNETLEYDRDISWVGAILYRLSNNTWLRSEAIRRVATVRFAAVDQCLDPT